MIYIDRFIHVFTKKKLFNLDNIFYFKIFFESPPQKNRIQKRRKRNCRDIDFKHFNLKKRKRDNPKQTRYLQVSFHTCMCMHVQLHRRPAVDSHYIIPDTTVLARAPI